MRVLIACEFSGRVREAFRRLGHDAWSCDILPAEDGSVYHLPGSVLDHDIANGGWDLMIAHPDCTYLTVSANKWAGAEWRIEARLAAMHFVRALWAFPVPQIAIENPKGVLANFWKPWDQIVQPWQSGHRATKETYFWLKGLAPLTPTDIVGPPPNPMTMEDRRVWNEIHRAAPGPERWKDRSRTFQGIADAMAAQWGNQIATCFSEQETRSEPVFQG